MIDPAVNKSPPLVHGAQKRCELPSNMGGFWCMSGFPMASSSVASNCEKSTRFMPGKPDNHGKSLAFPIVFLMVYLGFPMVSQVVQLVGQRQVSPGGHAFRLTGEGRCVGGALAWAPFGPLKKGRFVSSKKYGLWVNIISNNFIGENESLWIYESSTRKENHLMGK